MYTITKLITTKPIFNKFQHVSTYNLFAFCFLGLVLKEVLGLGLGLRPPPTQEGPKIILKQLVSHKEKSSWIAQNLNTKK